MDDLSLVQKRRPRLGRWDAVIFMAAQPTQQQAYGPQSPRLLAPKAPGMSGDRWQPAGRHVPAPALLDTRNLADSTSSVRARLDSNPYMHALCLPDSKCACGGRWHQCCGFILIDCLGRTRGVLCPSDLLTAVGLALSQTPSPFSGPSEGYRC